MTQKLVYNDSSHSYWLDGKRVKSASKVAQIAADSFSIEQWRERMCVIGMTLEPALRERVAVDLENKEAIQKVAEEAKNVAKANTRAQRGTQRHRVFELGLLGCQDQFITEQQIADWKVLERTLDAYGLTPIVDRVEQFIAWPDNGVVGRYDAYLRYQGAPVLVDLKGGENAVKYPHSTAVQLWLYRFAPQTSAVIVRNGDKSEVTEWTSAPDGADPDSAYVIYCDDHHDVGELWRIDLNAARSGGELALGVVEWRKSHNYGKELAKPVAVPDEEAEWERNQEDEDEWTNHLTNSGSSEASSLTASPPTSTPHGATMALSTPTTSPSGQREQSSPTAPRSTDPTDNTRRTRLLERYRCMSDAEKMAYCELHIDGNDLDAVEAGLDQVDRFNVVIEPASPTLKLVPPPPPEAPDEGGTVAPGDVRYLNDWFDALPLEARTWTGMLVAQGKKTHPFRIRDRASVRRYELYRGILAIAEWVKWGEE